MKYTIELTPMEVDALVTVVGDPQVWIENVVRERCRLATEEIVAVGVKESLARGEDIPADKAAIVSRAFARGWATPVAAKG